MRAILHGGHVPRFHIAIASVPRAVDVTHVDGRLELAVGYHSGHRRARVRERTTTSRHWTPIRRRRRTRFAPIRSSNLVCPALDFDRRASRLESFAMTTPMLFTVEENILFFEGATRRSTSIQTLEGC